MSTTAPSRLPRRLITAASAFALLLTGAMIAGVPAADASGSSGATATVTPTTTTVATPTTATFKVSNTKTTITKITITGPKGLPFTIGATQSGWTSALTPAGCGTTATSYCTATYTATATKYGVGNGANGNVSFSIGFTSPQSATTLAFLLKGKAGSDDLYLNKTLNISVTGAVVPSTLTLSGLTAPNPSPNYIAGTPVTGTVTLKDTNGNPIAITDTTKLGISQPLNPGAVVPTWTLPGDGTAKLTFTYNGTGTISFAATYTAGSTTVSSSPATSLTYVAGVAKSITLTVLTGPNNGANYIAGTNVSANVTAYDGIGTANGGKGNQATISGTGQLGISQALNPGAVVPNWTLNGDGTATLQFTYNGTGTITFAATYNNGSTTLKTQPDTSLTYVAGVAKSITLTVLTGPNNGANYTAGTNVSGTVTAYDGIGTANGGKGNQATISGTGQLGISQALNPDAVVPNWTLNGDGTATLQFTYNGTGTITFAATYNNGSTTLKTQPDTSLTYVAGAPAVLTLTDLTLPDSGADYVAGDTINGTLTLGDGVGGGLGNTLPIDTTKLLINQTAGTSITLDYGAASSDNSLPFSFVYNGTGAVTFTVTYDGTVTTAPATSLNFVLGPVDSITGVTVTGLPSTAPTIYSGDPITVAYVAKNKNGIQIDVDGSLVTVTPGGTGGFVPKTPGANQVVGYYGTAGTTALTVAFGGKTGSSAPVTFTKKLATDTGTFVPGVPAAVKTGNTQNGLNTCADTTACGWADLPNGANGSVTAVITGTTLDISGTAGPGGSQTFKDPVSGQPLYNNSAPLPVTFVCGQTDCPTTTMPQNNGTPPSGPLATVGSSCTVGLSNFYPFAPPSYTGTVFNYGAAGKYCLFDAPSERVDFAQAFGFSYQLAGQPLSPLTYSCDVAVTNGDGTTIARPIGALNPSVDYANATKIPDFEADGVTPLRACLNVRSIKPVITGAGTAQAQYYLNFTVLFADDITLRLK